MNELIDNTILKDAHIIKNSNYAALYFKSKNIFLPIELNKLETLNDEKSTKEKQDLLCEIEKLINTDADIEKLESSSVEKTKVIDTLEIIIQTDCNLNVNIAMTTVGIMRCQKTINTRNAYKRFGFFT